MRGGGKLIERAIALVGPTGTGKTEVGRRLAARLGRLFIDSDEMIERETGLSVEAIFERFGESGFRDLEREAIRKSAGRAQAVIATGGGSVCDPETRRLLVERCITFWLDSPPATIAQRLGSAKGRPLLSGKPLLATLEILSVERTPFYASAPHRIETDGLDPDQVVDRIVAAIAAGER